MSCRNFNKYLKVLFCFQVFFLSSVQFSNCQTIEPFSTTSRQDRTVDFHQLNDSIIVGVLTNLPVNLSTNFTLSTDSIINQICLLNINQGSVKYIPLSGNVDSFEYIMSGSSFIENDAFYFTTRKINRTNPPNNLELFISPPNSYRCLYKVFDDTINLVTNLYSSQEVRDFNAFTFKNLENEYVSVLGLSTGAVTEWKIGKNNTNGIEIAISDTITAPILKGIIQNPSDSSYFVTFINSSYQKLDKNLQTIGSPKYFRELNSLRFLESSYFTSKIDNYPLISGILLPTNVGDSVCISSGKIIDDSVYISNFKKLITYESISPNYNNYVFNSLFNSDQFENNYFYAYDKKQCFPGQTNCISKFKVIKSDSLNNTNWELEFGGDAGYFILKVLALKDNSCLVLVNRTNIDNGNVDIYYVHIQENGVVTNNFLPILGLEKLSIPVKIVFSLYPNPTSEILTIDNQLLEKSAKLIAIIDFEGKVVYELDFQKTINISELSTGNYIYRIETENGKTYDTKFIKR